MAGSEHTVGNKRTPSGRGHLHAHPSSTSWEEVDLSRERGHKMKQRWTVGFFPPGKSRSCSCLPLSSCKKSRDCKEEHTLMLMIINSLENGQSRTEVNPETDFLSLRVEWDVKVRRRSQSWPLFHETICSVSACTLMTMRCAVWSLTFLWMPLMLPSKPFWC